ncbi:unnamed protein product [Anisakis simplex]|uniref:Heterogeneous nuclear ribonucleoprotein Q n=1 Tax=Anisakis simplex TaxID=6269 RepID=A0A0M3JTK1_ANISI|nr:unnamed protein product [Anisakis simplex]
MYLIHIFQRNGLGGSDAAEAHVHDEFIFEHKLRVYQLQETEKQVVESNDEAPKDTNTEGVEEEQMETANGTEAATVKTEETSEYAENEAYKKLRSQSVEQKVAEALVNLYETRDMKADELDERAVEMLRGFPIDQELFIVEQIKKSGLVGVQNKAQFLMSVMRNFRDKVRQLGPQAAMQQPLIYGPDGPKIKEILERTGYRLEVTIGQRKYGGPPPDWDGPATGPVGAGYEVIDSQIYVGKIPKEVYEDTLIPLFEEIGKMWDLRLMMDPLLGRNRGYAFVTYCDKEAALEAAKKYDGYEIVPGKKLKVNVSVANTRLFIGNIPKSKSKEEILAEFKEHAEGVVDCIVYSSPDGGENRKNRGFCFLDFNDHKTASDVKRKLHNGKIRPWNSELVVDWAEQQDEPDEETMSKVRVLYVRNLKEAVTEDQLREMFSAHGELERAKKIRDYAFIHFKEREAAVKAMQALNGTVLEGIEIDISLAKPQSDKKKANRGGPRGQRGFGESAGGGWGGRTGGMVSRRGGAMGTGYGARSPYGGMTDYGGYGGYDPYGGKSQPDSIAQSYGMGNSWKLCLLEYAGYDEYYGYGAPMGGGYGGYAGYDSYGYGGGPDPYAYGAGYSMGRNTAAVGGGAGGGMRGGMWRIAFQGYSSRASPGRGKASLARGAGGIARGSAGRSAKRRGDGVGGPASKREFGNDDFSADVNMASF